ncbi:Plastid-lipid associated protein PAP / fibrillin family protein [Quillaja saponaria]|uniref:Plastid-lipid associated protein PAP / fibrillin family protein n=1 Tax=Quillaja saponaria TaxID=32244 RepID=A0AAD7PYE3_QUISA|nr:Plastid-lipid associated protein PAP / fibrillin family protein [Quillaja saponaria]
MASVLGSIPAIPSSCTCSSFASSTVVSLLSLSRWTDSDRKLLGFRRSSVCRAMIQQAVQGAPAAYAKEMERLSAKESLLLAFKDARGFEALVTGKTTNLQRIDVNKRITGLKQLNPTLRPTTHPFWKVNGTLSGLVLEVQDFFAARFIFENFPSTLANFSKMDVFIKDGYAKVTANIRLLNSIESKFVLSTRLSVEGPLRMKEEYVEGILESPTVIEERVPEQLKGALGQAVRTMQQLPVPIWDAASHGLTIPLSVSFQRFFMISYLDQEILIIRNTARVPEVLTRLDVSPSSLADQAIPNNES